MGGPLHTGPRLRAGRSGGCVSFGDLSRSDAQERSAVSEEPQAQEIQEVRVDSANLYREEVYTDLRVATIRVLAPVKPDGTPDPSRDTLFSGQTTLLSQAGPLPVECAIEAKTLQEAMNRFPQAMKEAVDRLIEEAREIRRREASRIVVPGGPLPGGAGGMPGGGLIGGRGR